MSKRSKLDVKTTMDSVSIQSLRIALSGTAGGNMTGSILSSTDNRAVVAFSSASLPSGSFTITFPADNRYTDLKSWHLTLERSGSADTADVNQYSVVQYGHDLSAGTFTGGIVKPQLTGSGGIAVFTGRQVGAVPTDTRNPSNPPVVVNFTAVVRDGGNRRN